MSPIKPERKKLYPVNWRKISELVLDNQLQGVKSRKGGRYGNYI